MGGDDQWGNIVSGADLIRRVDAEEVFGLTFPLVTRADGKKMGKTEEGAIFLDPEMVTPYEFFQYWRNVPDGDVEKFLLMYTFLPVEECRELGSRSDRAINESKERLAFEVTALIHGKEAASSALEASRAAFAGGTASADLDAIPHSEMARSLLESGIAAVDLFSGTDLCGSKGEARRLIDQGGARVNDRKIAAIDELVDLSWLKDDALLLRAGKKRYFRISVR